MSDVKAPDDVLVCRCGEISRQEVLQAIADGARTIDDVKRMTRAGMGICQGRTCSGLVAQLIHAETGLSVEEIGHCRGRAPVRPVPADVLASIHPPQRVGDGDRDPG